MKNLIQICTVICATAITTEATLASDAIDPGDRDVRWVLGGGGVVYNNAYRGEDQSGGLFPNIRYNGDRFFIKNATFNVALGQFGAFSTGLTLSPDRGFLSDEDDYRDNTQLAGLQERDATIEGGFYVNHTTALGRANLRVLSDLGHEHDGETATLSYIFDLKAGSWHINPVVGLHWMSDQKTNHYYGVSLSESNAQRSAYTSGSALNAFFALRTRYEFSTHWDIGIEAGVTRLDSGISESPIVDEEYSTHGAISVSYNF